MLKTTKLSLYIFFIALMSGCGGGGSSSSTQPSSTTPLPSPVTVSISASTQNAVVNDEITLTWSSTNALSCVASGDWTGNVNNSGSKTISLTKLGVLSFNISCDSTSKSTNVTVLDKNITIVDPVLADVFTRLGYPVVNSKMLSSDALKIKNLCITSMIGWYGTPDQKNTALYNNGATLDAGVRCAYTAANQYIKDTSGFESLLNLETARIDMHQFTSINISQLSKLSGLFLWGNPITAINLKNNTSLKQLGLSESSLKTIDVSALSSLEELAIHNNEANRTFPYTTTNNGTVVYGFEEIDISNIPNLKRLYIMNNRISKIDLSKNSGLIQLTASNNNIQSLDLSKNYSLDSLMIDNNNLNFLNATGITNGGIPHHFYVQNNPNLTNIYVIKPDDWTKAANAKKEAMAAGREHRPSIVIDDHMRFKTYP